MAGDASGNGEGQTFLGFVNVTTDALCGASFVSPAFAIPPGQTFITATANDPSNNTSEFSAWFSAAAGPTPTPTHLYRDADTHSDADADADSRRADAHTHPAFRGRRRAPRLHRA